MGNHNVLSPMGEAAVNLAAKHGLAIYPVMEGGKRPATRHGFKDATTDPDILRALWSQRPGCNLGFACGKPSGGVIAIDVDGPEGEEFIDRFEHNVGRLPETVEYTTGKGRQILFRVDREIRQSVNGAIKIDVRGDGSGANLPPSVHPNGRKYAFARGHGIDEIPIADADDVVYALIDAVRPAKKRKAPTAAPDGTIPAGERNKTLFDYTVVLVKLGYSDADVEAKIVAMNSSQCDPPLGDDEVGRIVQSALSYRTEPAAPDGSNIPDVRGKLVRNRRGGPKQCIENHCTVLENDDRLKGRFFLDLQAMQKMVELPVPWDGGEDARVIDDRDLIELAMLASRDYGLDAKSHSADAVYAVCYRNTRNMIEEYLRSLEWDGVSRVDSLLCDTLGAEHNAYNYAVSALMMRTAVARALHPGIKADTVTALVGRQGIGKSTLVKLLAVREEWGMDNLHTVEGKEAAELLRGKWIVEIPEGSATKKARTVEAVKAFITSCIDRYRIPYDREAQNFRRSCIFVATTNSHAFLTDPTGNRRWLPVACGVEDIALSVFDDGIGEHIEQAWAEAIHRWDAGEQSLVLPDDLLPDATVMQERYAEDDPRIGQIQQYLDWLPDVNGDGSEVRVCAIDLAHALFAKDANNPSRSLVNDLHEIMAHHIDGWMPYPSKTGKARTAYGVQRCYVRDPGYVPEPEED